MNNSAKVSSNPFDIFVIGARKGFNIAINNLMPNVLMAYVIAEMLNLLGVMQIIGHVCAPLMGLFSLPGEAITVLLTSAFRLGGNRRGGEPVEQRHPQRGGYHDSDPGDFPYGVAASVHGAPARRGGCPEKYWPLLMAVSIINAVIAMLVMRVIA